jgi:hypothetical protein
LFDEFLGEFEQFTDFEEDEGLLQATNEQKRLNKRNRKLKDKIVHLKGSRI